MYNLDKKYKSVYANKYMQLIKYDNKYKKKYGVVVQGDLKPATLLKKAPAQVVVLKILKNTFLTEQM